MNSPIVVQPDPMRLYRAKRDEKRPAVRSKYAIIGFISSGTYGRVYKAQALTEKDGAPGAICAIKKFKPDKEGEVITYTGISQSACREIALNREIENINVIKLREVMLEDKSIYMIFEYAEHDFLQIIHHHTSVLRSMIPLPIIKTLLYQLLNGVEYLHNQHILHRDLKPANILVTSGGTVKIGDLGLARLVRNPLQPLSVGDKVVVTIWYRAPELLLGTKHYTTAVDNWAVGCIFAELLSLRPIFKGEEAKLDAKKNIPFQRDQATKIFEILGTPDSELRVRPLGLLLALVLIHVSAKVWPGLIHMPEYQSFLRLDAYRNNFRPWFSSRLNAPQAFDLICRLFIYDPITRLNAREALSHKWFTEEPLPTANAFASLQGKQTYPLRRVTNDDGTTTVPTAAPATAQPQGQAPSALTQGQQQAPGGSYIYQRPPGQQAPQQPLYVEMTRAQMHGAGAVGSSASGSRKKPRLK